MRDALRTATSLPDANSLRDSNNAGGGLPRDMGAEAFFDILERIDLDKLSVNCGMKFERQVKQSEKAPPV